MLGTICLSFVFLFAAQAKSRFLSGTVWWGRAEGIARLGGNFPIYRTGRRTGVAGRSTVHGT